MLPHIGLILLSILYIFGGALAFYQLERPNEIQVRKMNLQKIDHYRKYMLNELWIMVNDNSTSDGIS